MDVRELYQELILEHGKRPRNFRVVEGADRAARGYNPLCGDDITVFLRLAGETIEDLGFQGSGCAICTASASVMTETAMGRTAAETEALFERFHGLVTGRGAGEGGPMGKLEAFAGVSEFPVRVKCASLPWHTLKAALSNQREATTE